MNWRYLVGISVVIVPAVVFTLSFRGGPSPESVLEPTAFDGPIEIGASISERLASPLDQEPLVIFGVTPDEEPHRRIVEGFLAAAKERGKPVSVVFKEALLDAIEVPEGTEVVPVRFNDETMAVVDLARQRIAAGQRVLVYTVSIMSSHLLLGNPVHRFEQLWGKPVFSISTVGISLRREQAFKVDPPCVGSERDGQGTAGLGCAALLKSRQLFRKNIDNRRYVALLEKRDGRDHLLFVAVPPRS